MSFFGVWWLLTLGLVWCWHGRYAVDLNWFCQWQRLLVMKTLLVCQLHHLDQSSILICLPVRDCMPVCLVSLIPHVNYGYIQQSNEGSTKNFCNAVQCGGVVKCGRRMFKILWSTLTLKAHSSMSMSFQLVLGLQVHSLLLCSWERVGFLISGW